MVAFAMAFVLAGGVTFVMVKRLRPTAAQPETVTIVAAANELPPGIALTPKDITMIVWPATVPLEGSFSKIDDVVGKPLLQSIGAKEPILQRDLGIEGSGLGLSAKIPPGMRATAVRSNEIVGVAGFLYPGSRVDVLSTFNNAGNAGSVTQTVLQNVEVLTAGQTIEPDPQGRPQTVNVVTLLVNPQDSEKLLLASTQGNIQFVLRNGTDTKKDDIRPIRIEQLLAANAPPPQPAPVKTAPVRTPAPAQPGYVLEVIQGTQKTVQRFDQHGAPGGTPQSR
jgi:pilus assembly protein CpaB